jgi:hypothetical protein
MSCILNDNFSVSKNTRNVLNILFLHKMPFSISNKKLEIDYLRFIYLKVITQDVNGSIISPTIEIDEIWHQHLLHNKNYFDMCLSINFIVYHYPERADDTEEVKNKRIDNFRKLYYKYFQTVPFEVMHDLTPISDISDNSDEIKEYSPPVTIFVKTVTNKNITIEISLDCSIAQLKNLILFKENIPIEIQKLLFAGKRIDYDNKKLLREFNIQHHSTIHIMLQLKGC